jgi:hypothetical protein
MMRPILIFAALFIVAAFIVPASAQQDNAARQGLDASINNGPTVVFEYSWVYGITERAEIRSDGIIRVERHVHDTSLFNDLRAKGNEKGSLTPYAKEILSMEEGEYDKYWVADIGKKGFDDIVNTLDAYGFPDIENTYGDWETWAVTLRNGSGESRVTGAVRETGTDFDRMLNGIDKYIDTAKAAKDTTKDNFDKWAVDANAGTGGAS